MKFLFVTYRWGEEITGGAEIHHRRLLMDLIELGHEVEVWTTTCRDIEPVAHWGIEMSAWYEPGSFNDNGAIVRRFPLDRVSRKALGIGGKFLQRRVEREWDRRDPSQFVKWASSRPEAQAPWVHLLDGWHPVELSNEGYVARWSSREARLAVFPEGDRGRLYVEGHAMKPTTFSVRDGLGNEHEFDVDGKFEVDCDIERGDGDEFVALTVKKAWRPLMDHRTLGLYVKGLRWHPHNTDDVAEANMWNDYRSLGRPLEKVWWAAMEAEVKNRPPQMCRLFDWLRGPRSKALTKALSKPPSDADYVIAANFPWSIVPLVKEQCPLPLLAMPLWHLEDDFYYWPHYLEALQGAKLVMANTDYAAKEFYRPRGINATFVGPGVPLPPEKSDEFDVAAWRGSVGIEAGEAVILSVCRKGPEKRYDLIADAVERINEQGRKVRFVLIGPDHDQRETSPNTLYLGRVDELQLDRAFRSCDVFALMSETESFGMVLAEAWLRERPVIANRTCGPAASLIDEGVDGLLATDVESLAKAILELLDDPNRAADMGKKGSEKSRQQFVQRAATERLLDALNER